MFIIFIFLLDQGTDSGKQSAERARHRTGKNRRTREGITPAARGALSAVAH